MRVTVAISTFNRAESLRRTLESLAAMQIPDGVDWEVIVVNNNSTDHTDAVIASFADRLPIRREFEGRPGKSNACNRAVDVATGDYFVWTDDDAIVGPGWLAAYVEAFRRRPEAAFFGGPIRPRYEQPVVKWVIESEALLGAPFAIRDLGDEALPLAIEGNRLPLGVNMALRGVEQRAYRYDPEIGPGTGLGGHRRGEEHELIERILAAGGVGYPVPAAGVEHCIGHERQTASYLMRFFAGAGDEDAYLQHIRQSVPTAPLFGVPRWLWRALIQGWLLYRIHRVISPGPVWVRYLRLYAYASGAIRYWRSAQR
jgi:glycosyltransferase involved in cell wall biosynthesis